MATTKARCQDATGWLRARKIDLAPLTGQDTQALRAFAHLMDLYCYSDEHGRRCAIEAMRATVRAMQPQCRGFCRELIAWAREWSDRETMWPLIVGDSIAAQVMP